MIIEHKDRAVDGDFIKSIFNPREIIFPITARRIFFWVFYLILIGAILSLEFTVGLTSPLINTVKSNLLPLMIILYGFEPLLMIATMAFTQYPPLAIKNNKEDKSAKLETPSIKMRNKKMAVVIPAHYSAEEIVQTITACREIVDDEQIFVIGNANSSIPVDNTIALVQSISQKINCYWCDKGNKTIAQLVGARLAHLAKYEYVLLIDDDVHPPADFCLDETLFAAGKKAVFYPIRAISKNKANLLVRWQDIEYQQSDHFKLFEARFHGVLFPHGAVALWSIHALLEVLLRHDTRFVAEDVQMGLISEYLRYFKVFDARYYFPTLAPTTVIGTPLNLYQQRVRSWNIGIQTLNLRLLKAFFSEWTSKPSDLLALKLSQFYTLYNNYVEWTRLFVMVVSANDPSYWYKLAAVIGGQQATTMIWHYLKLRHRSDLQHQFSTVISMVFYRLLLTILTNFALIRLLTIYLPGLKETETMLQLEQRDFFKNLPANEKVKEIVDQKASQSMVTKISQCCLSFFQKKSPQPAMNIMIPAAEVYNTV